MLEASITRFAVDDAKGEDPAAIRARLKGIFNPGFGRRATVLGLLVGNVLRETFQRDGTTIVYASAYGETRTLADFLDSFPHPSPTQFQTSVHPSAIQQVMIDRKQPVAEYLPLAGGPNLPARAILTALTAPAQKVTLCGGEEWGTWMAECKMASDRSFAFSLELTKGDPAGALGRLKLEPTFAGDSAGGLSLPEFFDLLNAKRRFDGPICPEWRLKLEWT